MAFFQVRVQNAKFTFSPLSSDSMLTIGQVLLDHIVARIQSVHDAADNPAKPLKDSYAQEKAAGRYVSLAPGRKYKGLPVRDWTLRGRTLGACKVKFASQDRATIGPTSQETGMIITVRNKVDNMWGVSPSDAEVMVKAAVAVMRQAQVVRVERAGGMALVA
jgi:hypothetical protein